MNPFAWVITLLLIIQANICYSNDRYTINRKIGIGFASEYAESISSSFGHVFIIDINEENLLLSQTYTFLAAVPSDHNLLKKIKNGFNGTYTGRFHKIPLYRLQHLYVGLENRTLHIYEFKKNSLDIDLMLNELENQRNYLQPYDFANDNCSTKIRSVLRKTLSNKVSKPQLDYPGKLIDDLKETDVINLYSSLNSLNGEIHQKGKSLSSESKKKIIKAYDSKKVPEQAFSNAEEAYSNAIYQYLSFKSQSVKDHQLILDVATEISAKTNHISRNFPKRSTDKNVIDKVLTKPSSYKVQLISQNEPILENVLSLSYNVNPFAHLNLGSYYKLDFLEASILTNQNRSQLGSLKIIDIESSTHFEYPSFLPSWILRSKSEISLTEIESRRTVTEAGLGIAYIQSPVLISSKLGPSLIFIGTASKIFTDIFHETSLAVNFDIVSTRFNNKYYLLNHRLSSELSFEMKVYLKNINFLASYKEVNVLEKDFYELKAGAEYNF